MDINAYPLDNTSYYAEDLRHWNWARTSGVFASDTNLQVVAYSGMNIQVKSGVASINKGDGSISAWIDSAQTLTVPTADGTNPRIDKVVLAWDITNNKAILEIVSGTAAAAPSVPSITRTSTRWEIILAYIRVEKGATAITSGKITDTRLNESVCGLTTNGVETLPTTSLQAQVTELLDDLNTALTEAKSSGLIDGSVTQSKLDTTLYSSLAKVTDLATINTSITNLTNSITTLTKHLSNVASYVKTGTKVLRVENGDSIQLLTKSEILTLLGLSSIDMTKLNVTVGNGDGNAQAAHVTGSTIVGDVVYAIFDRRVTGLIRISYSIIYG